MPISLAAQTMTATIATDVINPRKLNCKRRLIPAILWPPAELTEGIAGWALPGLRNFYF